jgi:hypothetical protein
MNITGRQTGVSCFCKRVYSLVICFLLASPAGLNAQLVSVFLPQKINKTGKYLFYLHGAVVTRYGNNAVNDAAPEWGPYEYYNILDSLQKQGFYVISEIRKIETPDSVYVQKIKSQADSLLRAGVPPKNMIILGASAGWTIALKVSGQLQNPQLKFVLMGGCWENEFKNWRGDRLYGHFLSVIETTDPHKTCGAIFKNRKTISSFKEVILNTGLSHGFFYRGRKEWIEPVVRWAGRK